MIILNAKKIRDFQTCELSYRYRHLDEVVEPVTRENLLLTHFEEEIKKVMSFFFYKKQGGNTPSYNALLSRWERNWFRDGETAYDISMAKHPSTAINVTSLTTRAASVLLNFYNDFSDDISSPIMINETYDISIDNNIRLSETFDIGLKPPSDNKVLMMKWVTRGRGPLARSIDYGLEFALMDYIYKNKTSLSDKYEANYATYEIGSKTNTFKIFNIKDKHRDMLSYWIDRIDKTEIHIPRRGMTTACKGCNFDALCSSFELGDDLIDE